MVRLGFQIAVLTFAADRATKWLALEVWDLPTRSPIRITPFFNLWMTWNSGVSFGMFQSNSSAAAWLLVGFAVAVSAALAVWLTRTRSVLLGIALGFVIGGALGNALDRVLWGRVADFLDLHRGTWHWPVFNVADAAIVAGFALIVLDGFVTKRRAPVAPAGPGTH